MLAVRGPNPTTELASPAAGFPRLVPGLDFKSSVERVTTFQAGSIPVPRRQSYGFGFGFGFGLGLGLALG